MCVCLYTNMWISIRVYTNMCEMIIKDMQMCLCQHHTICKFIWKPIDLERAPHPERSAPPARRATRSRLATDHPPRNVNYAFCSTDVGLKGEKGHSWRLSTGSPRPTWVMHRDLDSGKNESIYIPKRNSESHLAGVKYTIRSCSRQQSPQSASLLQSSYL